MDKSILKLITVLALNGDLRVFDQKRLEIHRLVNLLSMGSSSFSAASV